jgi:hypothetical protein
MIHAGDSAVRMPHLTAIGFQILAGPRAVIGSNILAGPPTDLHSRWNSRGPSLVILFGDCKDGSGGLMMG